MKSYTILVVFCFFALISASEKHQKKSYITVHKEGRYKVSVAVTVDVEAETVFSRPVTESRSVLETLYDFKKNIAAYRSADDDLCYLEKLELQSLDQELELLEKVKNVLIRQPAKTLFVSNSTLSPEDVLALGGSSGQKFCGGRTVHWLVTPKPEDQYAGSSRQKRSLDQTPRSVKRRFQGQVQAHASPGANGAPGADVFAIASPDAIVARVTGGAGFAQANSHVTTETEYEHGKAFQQVSASSSMSSSGSGLRGSSTGSLSNTQAGYLQKGTQFGTLSPVSGAFKGFSAHELGSSPLQSTGFGSGSHSSSSSFSSFSSGSFGHSGLGQLGQAFPSSSFFNSGSKAFQVPAHNGPIPKDAEVTQAAGSQYKTYTWKVKQPNGYTTTHWYTGPLGPDNRPLKIEGPLESSPLELNIPGFEGSSHSSFSSGSSGHSGLGLLNQASSSSSFFSSGSKAFKVPAHNGPIPADAVVTQAAGSQYKTYTWKVKHPNGYTTTHWYTGPLGPDNKPLTIDGPTETSPPELSGFESSSRTVAGGYATGGGDLSTIGIGLSQTDSSADRVHEQAQSLFSSVFGQQSKLFTESSNPDKNSPGLRPAPQVQEPENTPQPSVQKPVQPATQPTHGSVQHQEQEYRSRTTSVVKAASENQYQQHNQISREQNIQPSYVQREQEYQRRVEQQRLAQEQQEQYLHQRQTSVNRGQTATKDIPSSRYPSAPSERPVYQTANGGVSHQGAITDGVHEQGYVQRTTFLVGSEGQSYPSPHRLEQQPHQVQPGHRPNGRTQSTQSSHVQQSSSHIRAEEAVHQTVFETEQSRLRGQQPVPHLPQTPAEQHQPHDELNDKMLMGQREESLNTMLHIMEPVSNKKPQHNYGERQHLDHSHITVQQAARGIEDHQQHISSQDFGYQRPGFTGHGHTSQEVRGAQEGVFTVPQAEDSPSEPEIPVVHQEYRGHIIQTASRQVPETAPVGRITVTQHIVSGGSRSTDHDYEGDHEHQQAQEQHNEDLLRQRQHEEEQEIIRQQEVQLRQQEILRQQQLEQQRQEVLRQQELEQQHQELLRQQEMEQQHQEMLRQQQLEQHRQEMLQQQRLEEEKQELLRQQQLEQQRQELLRQQEEQQRQEAERRRLEMVRQQELEQRRQEELRQREIEEQRRRQEELQKQREQEQERLRQEEVRKQHQEILRRQQLEQQRQELLKKQQEEERQRQEILRKQEIERQKQEKLRQEQLEQQKREQLRRQQLEQQRLRKQQEQEEQERLKRQRLEAELIRQRQIEQQNQERQRQEHAYWQEQQQVQQTQTGYQNGGRIRPSGRGDIPTDHDEEGHFYVGPVEETRPVRPTPRPAPATRPATTTPATEDQEENYDISAEVGKADEDYIKPCTGQEDDDEGCGFSLSGSSTIVSQGHNAGQESAGYGQQTSGHRRIVKYYRTSHSVQSSSGAMPSFTHTSAPITSSSSQCSSFGYSCKTVYGPHERKRICTPIPAPSCCSSCS